MRKHVLSVCFVFGPVLVLASGNLWSLLGAVWTATMCSSFVARAGLLMFGVGVGQCIVVWFGRYLRRRYELEKIPGGDKNRWPQEDVGLFESVTYPLVFYGWSGERAEAAAALVVGWIGLKTLGNWKAWQQERRADPPGELDEHQGRRRLYAFMLQNAFLVASGLAVAWLMHRV